MPTSGWTGHSRGLDNEFAFCPPNGEATLHIVESQLSSVVTGRLINGRTELPYVRNALAAATAGNGGIGRQLSALLGWRPTKRKPTALRPFARCSKAIPRVGSRHRVQSRGGLPEHLKKTQRPPTPDIGTSFSESTPRWQIRADIEIVPLRIFLLGALNWMIEWFRPDSRMLCPSSPRVDTCAAGWCRRHSITGHSENAGHTSTDK